MRPFNANTSDIELIESRISVQRVPRICEWCHEVFNELPQLEAHQIGCRRKKRFECSSCSEKFPTPRRLDKHMKFSHSSSNPRDTMSRSFDASTSSIDLDDSGITMQRVQRTCEWCHEAFNELVQLEAHQISCTRSKSFECSNCSPLKSKNMMSNSFDCNDSGFLENEDLSEANRSSSRRHNAKSNHSKWLKMSLTSRCLYKHTEDM